jgi:hypothetical protein
MIGDGAARGGCGKELLNEAANSGMGESGLAMEGIQRLLGDERSIQDDER